VFYYTDSKEGEKLALCMQAALVAGLDPANHRKAKGNKTYYMLKKTDAVLVICECGFLSNPEEEALLNTKKYQKKVADALCDGVLTYLGEKKNGKEKTQTKTEETAAGAASAYACPAGGLSGIRRI
jgi:N-acetylmuramoyl-L-alanine amidase